MNNNNNVYSLEILAKKRAEIRAEIEKSKEHMAELTHAIIAPPATKNNMELWMHYASNGMTAYRGLLTLIKFFQRIKGTFSRKNKSKSFF